MTNGRENDFAYVAVANSQGDLAHASSTSVHVPEAAVAASGAERTYAQFLFGEGPLTQDPHTALCGISRVEILTLATRAALGQLARGSVETACDGL